MDSITETIANNLQTIRKSRQMTLSDLAEITGVSKSMLGEIERGASNPTINVLWKISTGLRISISELIHEQTPVRQVVKKEERKKLNTRNCEISLIFQYNHIRNFEIYHLTFAPASKHSSQSHQKGVTEYTMVYEGTMLITVNNESFTLHEGDSFVFEADTHHSYFNAGDVITRAYSIIYYPAFQEQGA